MITLFGNKNFDSAFKSFVRTRKLACKISRLGAGRISEEDRVFWASVFFTRMCVITLSLERLNTHNIPEKFVPDNWDYASTFSLTRNLMECFHTLFYLCFDNISNEERDMRRQIFNLHDIFSREDMFSFIGQDSSDNFEEKQEIIEQIQGKLAMNSCFQSLSENLKKECLKGKKSFLLSREQIEESSGRDKQLFKFLYKWFSSNTHTYPLGFYRMIDSDRGVGVKTEVEEFYAALAMDVAQSYLVAAIQRMFEIYPDIPDKLSPQELQLVGYSKV